MIITTLHHQHIATTAHRITVRKSPRGAIMQLLGAQQRIATEGKRHVNGNARGIGGAVGVNGATGLRYYFGTELSHDV